MELAQAGKKERAEILYILELWKISDSIAMISSAVPTSQSV